MSGIPGKEGLLATVLPEIKLPAFLARMHHFRRKSSG